MNDDRLAVLSSRGHGDCFEAIRLLSDPAAQHQALVQYIKRHRGRNTKQVRRAMRMLNRVPQPVPEVPKSISTKAPKSPTKLVREQQRSRKVKK